MTTDQQTAHYLPELRRAWRGHAFYPALKLNVPAIYATERQPAAEKTIYAHYFVNNLDWWIAEFDPSTGEAFGYACLGDPQCAEWGYIALPDLEAMIFTSASGLTLVERDRHWTPTLAKDADLP